MNQQPPTILFLDDDEGRRVVFAFREPLAVIVTTAAACIARLKQHAVSNHPWSEVHLDHDLDGTTYQDSGDPTCGMEVVRWVLLNKPDVRTFVVHTHNEVAGPEIVRLLEDAGYRVVRAPFTFQV